MCDKSRCHRSDVADVQAKFDCCDEEGSYEHRENNADFALRPEPSENYMERKQEENEKLQKKLAAIFAISCYFSAI